jgi:SAM-dependent methyltransferase
VTAAAAEGSSATSACNLCGARDAALLSARDRRGRPLRTVICRRCGLCWTDPLPSAAELERYYREEYRLDYQGAFTPRRTHIYRAGRNALDRWRQLRPWLSPGARVLDVGAGGAELVYLLARLGYRAAGVEPNRGYAEYAVAQYGIDLRVGLWQEMDFQADSFDLVTMYHVLEHTADPRGALARIRRWLAPKGALAVEVPNVEAVCGAPGHRFHRAHLFSFNPPALDALGRAAGFAPVRTELSSDGGNIFVVFQPDDSAAAPAELPGNYERIATRLARHTPVAHYLSHYPYWRPLARLGRAVRERWGVLGRSTGRRILDACFSRAGIPHRRA